MGAFLYQSVFFVPTSMIRNYMNTKKHLIAVALGGYSPEWEISVKTGTNVARSLDPEKFDVYKAYIRPDGWVAEDLFGKKYPINKGDFSISIAGQTIHFDAVFNALHGTPGEDGLFQAYLDLLEIPHTSCSVFAAALTFNKAECNRLLGTYGVPVPEATYHLHGAPLDAASIMAQYGLPLFIKPSRSGSSFGVSRVNDPEAFWPAIEKAAKEDHHILIERMLRGTEVSCGVFQWNGQTTPIAITEIVPEGEYFDYEAKYLGKSQEITPARISEKATQTIFDWAIKVYDLLELNGICRIDFFIAPDDTVTLVEINSVPGLSDASIVPQQLQYRGWAPGEIFSTLLLEAIAKKYQA
jgi:D-alanine-D-alanine ligase